MYEPYSSCVASVVGKDVKGKECGKWEDISLRNVPVGSGHSSLNTIEEIELLTVDSCAKDLLKKYEDVFNVELPPGPPPKRDIEFKVDLIDKAIPKNAAPYKLSPIKREEIKRQVGKMLKRKLI